MFTRQDSTPSAHWMEADDAKEQPHDGVTTASFLATHGFGAERKSAESRLWLSHLHDDRMPHVTLGLDDMRPSSVQPEHDDSPWVLPPAPRPPSPIWISRFRRYRRAKRSGRALDDMYIRYYAFVDKPLFTSEMHLSDGEPFDEGTDQVVSMQHARAAVERQLFSYWAQWACDGLTLGEFPWPAHLGDYFELKAPIVHGLRHPKDLYCRFRPTRPAGEQRHVEIWPYDRLARDLQAYQLRYAKMYHGRFGRRCCDRLAEPPSTAAARNVAYPPLVSPYGRSTHGLLPRVANEHRYKYTLAVDLDGTLVYGAQEPLHSNGKWFLVDADSTRYYVYGRPHLRDFLESLYECYEMILFTTASQDFAERVMKWLNREKKYFSHCLHRKHVLCGHDGNSRLKHLRDIGRDMRKTVLLDNQLRQTVANWPNSALVKRWVGDPKDRCLLHIIPTLQGLVGKADVRPSVERLPCNSYAATVRRRQQRCERLCND